MSARLVALGAIAVFAACSSSTAPGAGDRNAVPKTYAEIEIHEHACMDGLQKSLGDLQTSRMDVFFSAALGGLVDCEAASGLAHMPTAEVNRMLDRADGKLHRVSIPKPPAALAILPKNPDDRAPYQRVCVAYMRRYLPASLAHAGDDADTGAAFAFNALEECDSDAGFATIAPHILATIMQQKKIL